MRKAWMAALALIALLLGRTEAQQPTAADFFRAPQVTSAKLSPDGRYVAAVRKLEQTGRHSLVLIALEGERKARVLAAYSDIDVLEPHWAGNEQIVFTLWDRQASLFHQRGHGLYAVDRDGQGDARILIRRSFEAVAEVRVSSTEVRTRPRDHSLDPTHAFHSVLRDGSAQVLVAKRNFSGSGELIGTELLRVDARSGRVEAATRDAPGRVAGWLTDALGRPRVAEVMAGASRELHWRPTADAPWTLLREAPRYVSDGGLEPLALGADNRLYARLQPSGSDTAVLATLDAGQPGAAARTLLGVEGFDFQGELVRDSKDQVLGVHFRSDAWSTHWFDKDLRAHQAAIDKQLSATVNLIDCGACEQPRRLLVQAYSDRQPAVYFIYDTASGKLEPVAGTRPWVQPAQMAARSFERIKARDGLSMPLHVTRPSAKGALPTIVLVHGGPWIRGGDWAWEAESQFLASRGYLVLEPEFRGSTGYGQRLFSAGFRQWGQAMQDDLIDALDWAVKQGLADPKRVCIAGASYGGYAALMGLVRHPDRFRCAVEWASVTDIGLMHSSDWSDLPGDWKRHGLTELVGDPKTDAEMLEANSPLKQAARITRPVLMAHGRQDRRVPFEHGEALHAALRRHGAEVEYLRYPEEGHGFALDKNEIDFWTRVEAFLVRQLKP